MVFNFHRMVVHVVVLGALALARPALAQEPDRSFDQGTAALKAGKYEEALRAFEAVWKERKTHDVAANLALAEAQLGRHRDAAEHFAFALRAFPVTGSEALRKSIAEAFAQSRARVATLRVTTSADGAEVRVDGRPVGRSPIVDEIFVEPGSHTIEAKLTGYAVASQRVDAKAASADTVKLALTPLTVPTSSGTVPPPPPRSPVPAFVIAGVGAASFIAGGVLLGVSATSGADLRDGLPRDSDGAPLCRKTPEPASSASAECDAWRAKAADAALLGNVGIGLLVVGGAAAGAVAAYLLWPEGSKAGVSASVRLVPVVGTLGGGALLQGSF